MAERPSDIPAVSRFVRFTGAGAIGFLIEALIITILVLRAGLDVYLARLVSFSVAVTATWLLNRRYAFSGLQREKKSGEYAGYVTVQIIGALINLGVYVAALTMYPALQRFPVVPLAFGAGVALCFNFLAMRRWVFHGK